ncbi:hypothetical protein [Asticcacaulis sp. AND118]|uniref:hypothetical protein n=1 Tax=Asticcacaulis sp. AND118 TaxID=2840468 RepID=UPI001CFFB0D2|nr:hypothetical protein [Asticcacaulis sp. AND118]UDF05626.1 hypothetical protein LH365_15670 [Asticcacaulis sp. AND118]
MTFKLWWAGAAIAALAGPVAALAADCDTLPPSVPATDTPRTVSADDLLRLRDIGPPGELAGLPGNLGVSPDHKHVAVVLRQADPDQNRYCTGLFVVPLDGAGQVRFLGSAGEPLYASINFWGIPDYPSGATVPITPKWSPDGKKIAIRVREAGRIAAAAPVALPIELTLGANAQTGITVYHGVKGSASIYSGITNNMTLRAAQHGVKFDSLETVAEGLTRGQARAIEQALIVRSKGINIRNSISPNHPYYKQAVEWGEGALKSMGY